MLAAVLATPACAQPSAEADAFDARLKTSMASAQGFRGALDGGWTLSGDAGDLYALQLLDGDGGVEGAWRDLRRPGALKASGFIDQSARSGEGLVLQLDGGAAVAILSRREESGWSGILTEGGVAVPVRLRRRGR